MRHRSLRQILSHFCSLCYIDGERLSTAPTRGKFVPKIVFMLSLSSVPFRAIIDVTPFPASKPTDLGVHYLIDLEMPQDKLLLVLPHPTAIRSRLDRPRCLGSHAHLLHLLSSHVAMLLLDPKPSHRAVRQGTNRRITLALHLPQIRVPLLFLHSPIITSIHLLEIDQPPLLLLVKHRPVLLRLQFSTGLAA